MKIWLPLLLGGMMALCGLPFVWSPLMVVPLAALLACWSRAERPKEVAMMAILSGTAYFAGHLIWLPLSFMNYLGPVSFGFVGLWFLEGLFWVLLTQCVHRMTPLPERRVWLYAFGWVILEYLRHLGPFAFPWGTLGYTLVPTPVVQVAEFGGVFLLSLLVTGLAAALVRLQQRVYWPLMFVGSLWVLSFGYGTWMERQPQLPKNQTALLVQPNYDVFDKFQGLDPVRLISQHLELSTTARPDELIVWSEGVVDGRTVFDLDRLQENPIPWKPEWASAMPQPMILGASAPLGPTSFANRAVAWDSGQETGHHDKHYLVPFGEFFPLYREWPALYQWVFQVVGSSFIPAQPGSTFEPLTLRGIRYGVYICYESVFPVVAREMVRSGAQVLINISNDGWFGKGQGLIQHFDMGRVRAIETRRYILRDGSVGVTAVIDPLGRTQEQLPIRETGALHASYRLLDGETLYVRFGDWPLWICILGSLGLWMFDLRERRKLAIDTAVR
ncbi:MAG: apolipoprotein N-acyltransferase [Deinococcaceae bacterium]